MKIIKCITKDTEEIEQGMWEGAQTLHSSLGMLLSRNLHVFRNLQVFSSSEALNLVFWFFTDASLPRHD